MGRAPGNRSTSRFSRHGQEDQLRATVSVIVCLLLCAATASADNLGLCRSSPKLVDACFKVHGRLSIANGSWNYRIWPVGSHRMLAVVDSRDHFDEATPPPLPQAVRRALGPDSEIFADFEVCPLTSERLGAMRHVCVAGASKIFVQKP